MTLADARTILPELHSSETDTEAETQSLTLIADWCSRFSPWTAPDEQGSGPAFAGGGSIWLDVTGCIHLFGDEGALMRDITDRFAKLGFTAYAAMADTPGAAWAIVRHNHYKRRRWIAVRKGQTSNALAPIPVEGLRLMPATVSGLQAVGLHQIGDLIALPRTALADHFGSEVTDRLDQALGDRPEPISPLAPTNPWYTHASFSEPISQIENITDAIYNLTKDLTLILEADGLGARRLILCFYHPDGKVNKLQVGTSKASRDADHLARLFTSKLDKIETLFGIDAITLAASTHEELSPTQTTFKQQSEKQEANVAALTDRLSNKLGNKNVVRLSLKESYIPERAVIELPAVTNKNPDTTGTWKPLLSSFDRPRPLRLLPRPEQVEAVAPIPDSPPVMFRWRKKLFKIERSDGPERITPEWWNDGLGLLETGQENARDSHLADNPSTTLQENIRDYYRVEDRQGQRFWVYREGVYNSRKQPQWYVHGIFG